MEYSSSPRRNYPAPRRVATAPIPLSAQFASPPSDGLVETLYNHPNAKIISFTASGRAFSRSLGRSSVFPVADEEPGTLSWSSQLERTIAVGPFRIYRAPGSVAFLNCGSALQPILPKSQCWCIDEVNSKFILQIRRPNYWRIELPVSDPEDQQRAQALRAVLDQILQFEKTECPFKRSFTVDLPERPQTPVKKRPWTPVRRPLSSASAREVDFTSSPSVSQTTRTSPSTPATRWDSDSNIDPVDLSRRNSNSSTSTGPAFTPHRLRPSESRRVMDDENRLTWPLADKNDFDTGLSAQAQHPQATSRAGSEIVPAEEEVVKPVSPTSTKFESYGDEKNVLNTTREDNLVGRSSLVSQYDTPLPEDGATYQLHEGTGYQGDHRKARLRRRAGFAAMRSFTSPPQLIQNIKTPEKPERSVTPQVLETSRPVTPPAQKPPQPSHTEDNERPQLMRRESEDSFHSVESWHSREVSPPHLPTESREASPSRTYHEGAKSEQEVIPESIVDELGHHDVTTCWDTASDQGSETSEQSVATAPDHIPRSESDTLSDISAANGDGGYVSTRPNRQRPVPSHRTTTSSISVRRRALSPLPPAANLFSPTSGSDRRQNYRGKLETVRKLPLTIIAKTCEMIMGPPSHLITLMLKVAARIAAGEWRGLVYGYNDRGEQIPVQWEYSDGEFSDWSDDEPYMGSHSHDHQPITNDRLLEGEETATSDDSQSWGMD